MGRKISLKKAKEEASAAVREKVESAALKFYRVILAIQRRWADLLQKKSERFSRKTKIICLSAFILIGTGLNVLPFVSWFRSEKPSAFETGKISVPVQVPLENTPGRDEADDAMIRDFERYLDSLKHSPGGRDEYDRTMRDDPGVLDSLRAFKRAYPKQ